MFLKPVISLSASTTTALEAATVPAVIVSIVSSSASLIDAEPITKLVPVIVVPVIAAAVEPPITVASIVPPFMSAVSATRASMFAVPSRYKSLNSSELVPKSTSLSVTGAITPSVIVNCEVPPAVNANVSAAGKCKPVLVSPVFVIEGADALPSPNETAEIALANESTLILN